MELAAKLGEIRAASAKRIPAESLEKMHRATVELRNSGIMDTALGLGAKMPGFELPNIGGEIVKSDDLLKRGNLVVTFYRGVW